MSQERQARRVPWGAKQWLVGGLGIGVIGLLLVGGWTAYDTLKQRYQAALASQRNLEQQLAQLQAAREHLAQVLTEVQQRNVQLSEAMSAKDEELQRAVERLMQEERVAREFEQKLQAMERHMQLLQGELAAVLQTPSASGEGAGQLIQLERVIVTQPTAPGSEFQGRVVSVHPEWKFVVIDLGWDVVKVGDVVSIYRNDDLLGKARVERVQEAASAATLLPEADPAGIHVNDAVRLL